MLEVTSDENALIALDKCSILSAISVPRAIVIWKNVGSKFGNYYIRLNAI